MKTKKEMRVYLIDPDQLEENYTGAYPSRGEHPRTFTDGAFIEEAERQGSVYDLIGFQTDFNDDYINPNTFIRFIEVIR